MLCVHNAFSLSHTHSPTRSSSSLHSCILPTHARTHTNEQINVHIHLFKTAKNYYNAVFKKKDDESRINLSLVYTARFPSLANSIKLIEWVLEELLCFSGLIPCLQLCCLVVCNHLIHPSHILFNSLEPLDLLLNVLST